MKVFQDFISKWDCTKNMRAISAISAPKKAVRSGVFISFKIFHGKVLFDPRTPACVRQCNQASTTKDRSTQSSTSVTLNLMTAMTSIITKLWFKVSPGATIRCDRKLLTTYCDHSGKHRYHKCTSMNILYDK